MSTFPFQIFSLLIGTLPTLAVWIVGIVLALQYQANQPNSVRLALIAFAILIAQTIFFVPLNALLPAFLVQGGTSVTQVGMMLFAVGLVGTLIRSVGYALLVVALLRAWRVNLGEGGAV
jgi:hypothetical protein